jgi:hypothetical protein
MQRFVEHESYEHIGVGADRQALIQRIQQDGPLEMLANTILHVLKGCGVGPHLHR